MVQWPPRIAPTDTTYERVGVSGEDLYRRLCRTIIPYVYVVRYSRVYCLWRCITVYTRRYSRSVTQGRCERRVEAVKRTVVYE